VPLIRSRRRERALASPHRTALESVRTLSDGPSRSLRVMRLGADQPDGPPLGVLGWSSIVGSGPEAVECRIAIATPWLLSTHTAGFA
jgi:hypothetical protein